MTLRDLTLWLAVGLVTLSCSEGAFDGSSSSSKNKTSSGSSEQEGGTPDGGTKIVQLSFCKLLDLSIHS